MSIIDYPDLDSDGCVLGPTIDVTWDAVGLDQISSAGLPLVDPTSYDAATGLMTAWKTASGPNGLATVEHSVAVDGTRPRPQQIKAGRSGALSAYFDSGLYEYDAAGNVTGFNGWTYQYDGLQRLTDAITPTGFPRSFWYDDFGNLTEVKDDGVLVKSIAVNAATNRLNGTGMAYDLRGNLVAEPVNGWTRNLRFDLGNRLVASWATGATAPSEVFGFAYDFTGERVLRYERDSGALINAEIFLRDESGNLLTELQWTPFDGAAATSAGSWARIRDHVYLGREPAVRMDWVGATPAYTSVVTDHLGSTRAEVSDTGVFESFTYWPYGELTQVPNYASLKGPHLFTAHEREHRGTVDGVMMGLDYMHARYYSPDLGRFLSVDSFDPIALQFGDEEDRREFERLLQKSTGWNRYSYVEGNPLRLVDPDGQAATGFELLLTLPKPVGVPAPPPVVVGGAGLVGGLWVGRRLGESAIVPGQTVDEFYTGVFEDALDLTINFSDNADVKDFVNSQVATVYEHIGTYSPPDPNDPDDQSRKQNLVKRMRKVLESARNRLKRVRGRRTREELEHIIRHAEEALERWISGG